MSIDSAINRFRSRQAEQFTTTVAVTRPATTGTYTRDDGYQRPATTVYEGVCKIRPAEQRGSEPQSGERQIGVLDFVGKFPVDTELARDDIVTVTDSGHDARLVGKRFKVTDTLLDEWQIAAVYALEHIAAPGEVGS